MSGLLRTRFDEKNSTLIWDGAARGIRGPHGGTARSGTRKLGGGDAADQIFLFGLGFGADGEGVEKIEGQGEAEGFVLTVAQLALAKNFHADDAFAGGPHFMDDADDGVWVRIHVRPDGIDSNEMQFDPSGF